MSAFLIPLLDFLQAYGYPMLGLYAFFAAFGVPLPISPLLLAAGAFSAQGHFNMVLLAALATGAAVAGDCAGYLVARRWGSQVLGRLSRSRLGRRFIKPQALERSRLYFRRHGGWAIFLTHFLLTALDSATNLVAGSELFPFRSFLFYVVPAEALGAIILLALGFAYGASWEAVGDNLGVVTLFALGLVCVSALTYRLLRSIARAKQRQRQDTHEVSQMHPSAEAKEEEGCEP